MTVWKDTIKDQYGNVIERGTPLNATNLNKIETGLAGVASQLAETVTLVSKNEGSTNDTTIIQSAINSASLGSGIVKLQKNKIYNVGGLTPKENVTIDLNGSTLKLRDNVNYTMFYEVTTKTIKSKNFSVINGIIDVNMQNNNLINQSAGVFWLKDWDGLFFDKLVIKNAFRNIFNLFACHNIKIPSVLCDGNGMTNTGNFYSYGATFEPGCKNIEIGNFSVKNMYGFGIHFYDSENIIADNLTFENMTHPSAIAITFTKAKRGKINNIVCKNVLGDSLEINASADIVFENIIIDSTGKRPLIFGDNGTGINNERITVNNIETTNTTGAESISVNYAKNVKIKFGKFDKGLSTMAGNTAEEVEFMDCEFGSPLIETAVYYNRFKHTNVKFSDILIKKIDNNTASFSNKKRGVQLAVGGAFRISLGKLVREGGSLIGKLTVNSTFSENFNQTTYQEHTITLTKINEILVVDGSIPRKVTVTLDTTASELVFTNNTGVSLIVSWNLSLQ